MIYVVSDDMTEFERARRIPFMLPTTFLGRRQYGFENEGDNDDSGRVSLGQSIS